MIDEEIDRKTIILSVICMISIFLVFVGVAYSWFSYAKSGSKTNTIRSGAITFKYTEGNGGITLNDALPMTDAQGMAQTNYFEFTIDSKTSATSEIPYDITVRRSGTGTNMDNVVKVYLTKVVSGVETPVEILTGKTIAKVSELTQYLNQSLNIDASKNERKLYNEVVPNNSNNYTQVYRLRMWIDSEADFLVQEEGIDTYPYNDKTYILKVNVYGVGNAVSEQISASKINTSTNGVNLQQAIDNINNLLN